MGNGTNYKLVWAVYVEDRDPRVVGCNPFAEGCSNSAVTVDIAA